VVGREESILASISAVIREVARQFRNPLADFIALLLDRMIKRHRMILAIFTNLVKVRVYSKGGNIYIVFVRDCEFEREKDYAKVFVKLLADEGVGQLYLEGRELVYELRREDFGVVSGG